MARWMCERTDDRTDGVHKARRAKLDREQKERVRAGGRGRGRESEGENEHAASGWGDKGELARARTIERER